MIWHRIWFSLSDNKNHPKTCVSGWFFVPAILFCTVTPDPAGYPTTEPAPAARHRSSSPDTFCWQRPEWCCATAAFRQRHPGPGQAEGIFYRPAHLAHEPRILRPALGQIPGEHPPQRPQHHGRRQGGQDQIRHLIPLDEQTHHVDDNGRPDGGQSQPISAVAAVHEPDQSRFELLKESHGSGAPLLAGAAHRAA